MAHENAVLFPPTGHYQTRRGKKKENRPRDRVVLFNINKVFPPQTTNENNWYTVVFERAVFWLCVYISNQQKNSSLYDEARIISYSKQI